MEYNPQEIEKKWQDYWEKNNFYRAEDFSKKKKFYVLIEFPYPSGAGLHVGHCRSYSAMDAVARKRRMAGYNVLFPIGWDAFGLPTENYALRTGIHPRVATEKNIANFKRQLKSLGISFDWSREINTTDTKYYKWTQWIFLKLLEKGLAYRAKTPVNWCPVCKTTLADEEVLADGLHERCGKPTEKRQQEQWLLRITQYARRLLDDLSLVDYSPKIAIQQVNWIGKKEGISIVYEIEKTEEKVTVFTTRPDTNFGATFIVLAPEHPLVEKIVVEEYREKVLNYVAAAKTKTEEERISQGRKKTGVFTGCYAINPLTNLRMPVWVSDFALMSFGTGAVVGVPGHDLRDFEFAKEFGLKIIRVVVGKEGDTSEILKPEQVQEQEGKMINSDFLNGLGVNEATEKMMNYIEQRGWGERKTIFHLRDWVFSRQHYWGEPIPVIYCHKCLENEKLKMKNEKLLTTVKNGVEYAIIPVPENQLPVELPYVERYEPSGTGESPLAGIKDWVETTCPKCGGQARRETDTMPNWAGSNWYYLAYLIADKLGVQSEKRKAKSEKNIFEECKQQIKYWMPVDWYNGGMEHTTLHLLYSRFIYKFLYDIGIVPGPEPYQKRTSHGMVLAEDGRKMSKSFGNVINPDEIIKEYGADALRVYEMFMGPFDQAISWSAQGVKGVRRFLERFWRLVLECKGQKKSGVEIEKAVHKLNKKIDEDLEAMKFNTAISAFMEFVNLCLKEKEKVGKDVLERAVILISPFAPHLAEELWQELSSASASVSADKHKDSIFKQKWPEYDPRLIKEEFITLVIQVNGRVRDKIEVETGISEEKAKELALLSKKVQNWISGKEIKKVIFVPEKLINIVI